MRWQNKRRSQNVEDRRGNRRVGIFYLFTHGTSQQRMQWLNAGMQSGNVAMCDTFGKAGIRL